MYSAAVLIFYVKIRIFVQKNINKRNDLYQSKCVWFIGAYFGFMFR